MTEYEGDIHKFATQAATELESPSAPPIEFHLNQASVGQLLGIIEEYQLRLPEIFDNGRTQSLASNLIDNPNLNYGIVSVTPDQVRLMNVLVKLRLDESKEFGIDTTQEELADDAFNMGYINAHGTPDELFLDQSAKRIEEARLAHPEHYKRYDCSIPVDLARGIAPYLVRAANENIKDGLTDAENSRRNPIVELMSLGFASPASSESGMVGVKISDFDLQCIYNVLNHYASPDAAETRISIQLKLQLEAYFKSQKAEEKRVSNGTEKTGKQKNKLLKRMRNKVQYILRHE